MRYSIVNDVRESPKKDFNDKLFRGYIKSIKKSAELNSNKAAGLRNGQSFMTFTIVAVGILVAFILISMGIGNITLD